MTEVESERIKFLFEDMDADYRDYGQYSPQVHAAIMRIRQEFDEIISLRESRIAELEEELRRREQVFAKLFEISPLTKEQLDFLTALNTVAKAAQKLAQELG